VNELTLLIGVEGAQTPAGKRSVLERKSTVLYNHQTKKTASKAAFLFGFYHQMIVVNAKIVINPTANPEYKNNAGVSCPL